MTYDHDKVLEDNTKDSSPAELRNLRIFAVSIIAVITIVFILMSKYVPENSRKGIYSTYRVSSPVVDNYDSILEYYKSWL